MKKKRNKTLCGPRTPNSAHLPIFTRAAAQLRFLAPTGGTAVSASPWPLPRARLVTVSRAPLVGLHLVRSSLPFSGPRGPHVRPSSTTSPNAAGGPRGRRCDRRSVPSARTSPWCIKAEAPRPFPPSTREPSSQ
jgi:hypothetical protein